MPTIFSHAVFAGLSGRAFFAKPVSVWFWLLTALCAMVPDADVVGFSFGVRYGSMFGHRGVTHSIVFALAFGGLAAAIADKFLKTGLSYLKLFVFFALATVSHPLLDMLTDGGSGVALLAPFSTERYFFPWRPIEVSPIGFGFFSPRGFEVIASELVWVWLPALLIWLTSMLFRRILAEKRAK